MQHIQTPRDRNEDLESFINDLTPIVTSLSNERSDKIIAGDFNIDMLKINTREKYSDFLDLMLNSNFTPKITLPTRLAERSATIIDNMFCNFTDYTKVSKSGIIITNLSDHFPALLYLFKPKNILQRSTKIDQDTSK